MNPAVKMSTSTKKQNNLAKGSCEGSLNKNLKNYKIKKQAIKSLDSTWIWLTCFTPSLSTDMVLYIFSPPSPSQGLQAQQKLLTKLYIFRVYGLWIFVVVRTMITTYRVAVAIDSSIPSMPSQPSISRHWQKGGIQLAVCDKNIQWSHCTAVHVVEETHTLCSCQGWAA